jgi:hypothetical protein
MKSLIITFCSFLIIAQLSAQSEFNYGVVGLTPEYVVIEIDSLSENDLYQRSLDWIKETYSNPDEVIQMTMENEKIRIEGYKENAWHTESMGVFTYLNVKYTIVLAFKNGRVKFEPQSLQSYNSMGQEWGVTLRSSKVLYKNNGQLRNAYQTSEGEIGEVFNSLVKSLNAYLKGSHKEKEDDNDDW